MKLITVIGARPQFIKAAAVSRVIRPDINEILIHTGQHYDENMSDIFFRELDIPTPDYNLQAGSGTHGKQTGEMLAGIEEILLQERPDAVMIYGDTNSTLAGALAAVKLHLPIIHVEAGLRSYNMDMPEEINRILADRISSLLFCPTETACENLVGEGITQGVYCVGDVMCDAVLYYTERMKGIAPETYFQRLRDLDDQPVAAPEQWYLTTIHRAENTDTPDKLSEILAALEQLDSRVIFPVHPRIRQMVHMLHEKHPYKNITFTQPVGYQEMLYLTQNAKKVITDSGGLQKECYIMKTPCITVREQTEWVETLEGGCNRLVHPVCADILKAVAEACVDEAQYKDRYGAGRAAEAIKRYMLSYMEGKRSEVLT